MATDKKGRQLPDLSPEQVVKLQDALLTNADALMAAAVDILEAGNVALARSLAILSMEESGKAIAIHKRRIEMVLFAEDGDTFRCDMLDALWASHSKKLEAVHEFLVNEDYWFGAEPADPERNQNLLGSIKAWSRRHDKSKQRGFYVELGRSGEVVRRNEEGDEAALRQVMEYVHQIGWQIRLGEHIEGKRQDERERGMPPASALAIEAMIKVYDEVGSDALWRTREELRENLTAGVPGQPLKNAAYRFNVSDARTDAFRNVGKPGYEAETRQLRSLNAELRRWVEPDDTAGR